MVQIRWSTLSVGDLKEIFEYISRDSKRYATIQLVRLRAKAKILKDYPLAGKIVEEYADERFRELIEGNYRIIYKIVSSTQVDIITVHHSSRDLSKRKLL